MSTDDLDRLARGIGAELRRFVRDSGRRRSVPLVAYVGVPGWARTALPDQPDHDRAMRTDLVERVVDGLAARDLSRARACAWVTRPGPLAVDTREQEWYLASRAGFAAHGLELPAFFVVNRRGWHEVRTGRSRSWRRLRPPTR